jgi:fatty-acyl-CoA synthase
MFISGGENVFPGEVEAALLHLPSVREAAVVAAPHPRWGEAGVAFVVGGDPDTLIPLLRERIGGYKVPRLVIAMEALPRGATGKVDKRALTQRAIEETEGSWDKPTTSRGC